MRKATIQTSLLDCPVRFIHDLPTNFYPSGTAGASGRIRSVYTDSDGSPKYTVERLDGKLIEAYSTVFVVRGRHS